MCEESFTLPSDLYNKLLISFVLFSFTKERYLTINDRGTESDHYDALRLLSIDFPFSS